MDLTGILPLDNPGIPDEGDFIGEDGMVYCGKCKHRKQLQVSFGNETHVVRCMCKCESKKLEDRKKQDEYEEQTYVLL